MDNNYSSDKPIQKEDDDRFQRYGFAKRIASTIIERQSTDCIVIGLYGAWGEGKTSVLHFINSELLNQNIIIIKFNPWRFKDEDSLLSDFFKLLAKKLNASLQSDGDKVSNLLKKYAKLTAPMAKFIPYAGEIISNTIEHISDVLPTDTLEELKEKIDDILKENKNKIVVIIDDIDRLDKNEIHSIFRLVKLTADFYNTTYILSFDEEMVSAAIGGRFGEGNKESGKNFIEKIIQVPLKLPLAQPAALQQFCLDIINNVFNTIKVSLSENDGKIFSIQFQSNILIRLNTPRLAIRYGNSLSFSVPLLFGEVNIDDLLLIEAIKIFYPNFYEFIKINPDFFIGSFSEIFKQTIDNKKVDLLNKHLEDLGTNLSKNEKECIKALLIYLFPRLNEIYNRHIYSDRIETELYQNMRIGSPKYFNRFFAYTVIKGDLSDVSFRNFISRISEKTILEVSEGFKYLINQSSANNFLEKLRSFIYEYNWEISKKIASAIVLIPENFQKPAQYFVTRFLTSYGQSQLLISQLIQKHNQKQEAIILLIELIKTANSFEYIYDLISWLWQGEVESRTFSDEELLDLDYKLLNRAKSESKDISLLEIFQIKFSRLMESWGKINLGELLNYVKDKIEKDPKQVIYLLKIYTHTIQSTLFALPFKSDFSEDDYKEIVSIFDTEYIGEAILKHFGITEIQVEKVRWVGREDNTQTEINIARQFFYWKNNK